jgi:hypothetical protein
MAGIWTYLIPIVVLIALCASMLSRRQPPSLDKPLFQVCDADVAAAGSNLSVA